MILKLNKVKYEKKIYNVVNEILDLYVLEGGIVVSQSDCEPVKEPVKENKPKPKKKAE